jgi:hypothetical protein
MTPAGERERTKVRVIFPSLGALPLLSAAEYYAILLDINRMKAHIYSLDVLF